MLQLLPDSLIYKIANDYCLHKHIVLLKAVCRSIFYSLRDCPANHFEVFRIVINLCDHVTFSKEHLKAWKFLNNVMHFCNQKSCERVYLKVEIEVKEVFGSVSNDKKSLSFVRQYFCFLSYLDKCKIVAYDLNITVPYLNTEQMHNLSFCKESILFDEKQSCYSMVRFFFVLFFLRFD